MNQWSPRRRRRRIGIVVFLIILCGSCLIKTTLANSSSDEAHRQYTVSIDTTKIKDPQALLQKIGEILTKAKGGSLMSFKGTALKPALVGVLGIKGLAALTRAGIKWQAVLRETKTVPKDVVVDNAKLDNKDALPSGGVKHRNLPILDYPASLKPKKKTPSRRVVVNRSKNIKKSSSVGRHQRTLEMRRSRRV